MTDVTYPTLLDSTARTVVDGLHKQAKAQSMALFRHFLPRLPSALIGKPVRIETDMSFFEDKLLSLNPAQADLLYLLARARNVRHAVEFGTSFGVSTIHLAAAVRDAGGGRVIGTELVPEKAMAARANLAAAGLGDFVEIRQGDACETLRGLDDPVDFLLLDGWPQLAMDVLQIVEPKLANGAIVMVDNIAQFRVELRSVVAHLASPLYRSCMLPFRGGTLVAVHEG